MKRLFHLITSVGLTSAFLIASSYFASNVPPEPAKNSISQAIDLKTIPLEHYPRVSLPHVSLALVDNFSDCVEFGAAISPGAVPFSHSVLKSGSDPCKQLKRVAKSPGEEALSSYSAYARFWHGTAALERIVLGWISVLDLKISVTVLLLLLMVALSAVAIRKSPKVGFVIATYFFLCSDFMFQGLSLSHGISTLVGLFGVAAISLVSYRNTTIEFAPAVAAAVGVGYAYFAQLYTPLAFALLAGIMVLIVDPNREEPSRESALLVTRTVSWWAIGYIVMMGLRFLNLYFSMGLNEMLLEFQGASETKFTGSLVNLFGAIYGHVVLQPKDFQLRFFGELILLYVLGTLRYSVREFLDVFTDKSFKVLLIPIVYVGCWMVILLGHNGHGFVSNLTLALLTYLIVMLVLHKDGFSQPPPKSQRHSSRRRSLD